MADPQTVNVGLAVPVRGSDVGTWDVPLNADFTAIDSYFGGIQTISASNTPIVLTSPAGLTPTPSAGPTQSQNAVLRITGTLTGAVQVTLPLPGFMIVENLTTGAFVLSFRAIGVGEVIAIPQGGLMHIYNDGTNVRFVKGLAEFPGKLDFMGGVSAVPAWISSCTVAPFLIADGSVYNFSTYPALAALYLGNFGGNGITTFAVPDLRGRVPLAYDGTGTRITAAGCGLNGQTLGAALDLQAETLTLSQLPAGISVTGNITVLVGGSNVVPIAAGLVNNGISNAGGALNVPGSGVNGFSSQSSFSASNSMISNNTSGLSHPNVQPSQVAGIWLVKT
jgi:microcystin-dependent protein